MFAPFALLIVLAGLPQADYQVVYTVERLILRNDEPVPVFKRETLTEEKRPGKEGGKKTIVTDESTEIWEVTEKGLVIEKTLKNGMRERREVPLDTWYGAIKKGAKEYTDLPLERFGELANRKETDDYRTIAGHRCRKTVTTMTLAGSTSESVNWEPVEKKVRDAITSLESYWYRLDGGSRTLMSAEIVLSLKLGAP